MFSYFKTNHRRTGATPGSPRAYHRQASASAIGLGQPESPLVAPPQLWTPPAEASPISPIPPSLPPIQRVTSRQDAEIGTSHPPRLESNPISDLAPAQSANPDPPVLPPIPRIATRRQPSDAAPLRIDIAAVLEPNASTQQHPPRTNVGHDEGHQPPMDRGSRGGYRQPGMAPISVKESASVNKPFAGRPSTPSSSALPLNEQVQPPLGSSRRESSASSSPSSMRRSGLLPTSNPDSSSAALRTGQAFNSAAFKSSKVKKNLLHPVSLLRRRRTAQSAEGAPSAIAIGHSALDVSAMSLPDDYDPRIKGKGVHDFNAPKPRRNHSYTNAELSSTERSVSPEDYQRRSSIPSVTVEEHVTGNIQGKRRKSSERSEREHAPIFTENFDDDADGNAVASAVRRESLAKSPFIARMSRQLNFDLPEGSSSSTSPQPHQPHASVAPTTQRESKSTADGRSMRNSSDQSTVRSSISNDTKATSPPESPKSMRPRKSASMERHFSPTGLPKHLSSKASQASRFSFQLNSDQTIAQEKALEEKGKQKAALKSKSGSTSDDRNNDSNSDSEDESAFDDFDGAPEEEEIPMIGIGDEEDTATATQYFVPSEENTWTSESSSQPTIKPPSENLEQTEQTSGSDKREHWRPLRNATVKSSDTDDMYFDDGGFDEPPSSEQQVFDESQLDNLVGRNFARMAEQEASDTESRSLGRDGLPLKTLPDQGAAGTYLNVMDVKGKTAGEEQEAQPHRLSAHNLSAFHNALANAANTAEAAGKFQRPPSMSTVSGSDHDWYSHLGQDVLANHPTWDDDEIDGMEEDSMISAANAEVLDSDDADYYGREFGFYSASRYQNGLITNGGYFGSADEIHRTISGRNAVREPNLTPISERSEFSRRTSFTSLHKLGSSHSIPGSAVMPNSGFTFTGSTTLPSAGLRDLAADIVAQDHRDMSLDQLMRLRRRTFGNGSTTSSSSLTSASQVIPGPLQESPISHDLHHEDLAAYEAGEPHDDAWNTSRPQSLVSTSSAISNHSPSGSLPRTSHPQPTEGTARSFSPIQPQVSSSPTSNTMRSSLPGHTSTLSHTPSPSSSHVSAAPLPPPSAEQLAKFGARPPASSASYAERDRERQRQQLAALSSAEEFSAEHGKTRKPSGDTSVAYVMEDGQWYYERRRKTSGGDLMVIDRQVVSGGRI